MTDIVERLREGFWRAASETQDEAKVRRQRERDAAADEIERLRAALEFYATSNDRNVYPHWSDGYPGGVMVDANTIDCGDLARAALEHKP